MRLEDNSRICFDYLYHAPYTRIACEGHILVLWCSNSSAVVHTEQLATSTGARGSMWQILKSSRKSWCRPGGGDRAVALSCISWITVLGVIHPAGATASPKVNRASWLPSCPTSQLLLNLSYEKERCSWASFWGSSLHFGNSH